MSATTNIQAAVCRAAGAPLTIERLTLAPPRCREVQVQIKASAICHSDLMFINGLWGQFAPTVFGHEAAGVVVAAGDDAHVKIGARVLVTLLRSCGQCSFCKNDASVLCAAPFESDAQPRLQDKDGQPVIAGLKCGAFAEQVVVDCSQVAVLPDDIPFDEASLISCGVLTGWGAVLNTAQLPADASALTIAVVGCGGVGIHCVQASVAAGAAMVVAVDTVASKREFAHQLGAQHGIDPACGALVESAHALTSGRGFDVVFMAAAGSAAVEAAAQILAPMGTLVLAGMQASGDNPRLDTTTIANSQQRILGSKMGGTMLSRDLPRLLNFYKQGQLKLKELITARYALADINEAIAASGAGSSLRNVIVFDSRVR